MVAVLTLLTVGQSVLQVEGRVSENLAAVGAGETLGVEVVSHRFQAVLQKFSKFCIKSI